MEAGDGSWWWRLVVVELDGLRLVGELLSLAVTHERVSRHRDPTTTGYGFK